MDEEVEFGDLKVGLAPIVVKPPYHPFPPPIAVGLTADRLFGVGQDAVELLFVNAQFTGPFVCAPLRQTGRPLSTVPMPSLRMTK